MKIETHQQKILKNEVLNAGADAQTGVMTNCIFSASHTLSRHAFPKYNTRSEPAKNGLGLRGKKRRRRKKDL